MRRSALDVLGGMQSMSLTQLSAIFAVTPRQFFLLILPEHVSSSSICTPIASTGRKPGVSRVWPERAELKQIKSCGAQNCILPDAPLRHPKNTRARQEPHVLTEPLPASAHRR